MQLNIPNKDKAYIFRYRTDIQVAAGIGLHNTVKIKGHDTEVKHVTTKFIVTTLYANSEYRTNASVEIIKKDKDTKAVLQDAVFELVREDNPNEKQPRFN